MRIVWSIAKNTIREALRNRILYSIMFFGAALMGSATILEKLQVGNVAKVAVDIGLAGINIFAVVLAIFLGINLVSGEIQRKTVYTIIAKPVARPQFLAGKAIGLTVTILINVVLMSGLLAFLLSGIGSQNWSADYYWGIAKAVVMITTESLVIVMAAVMFSTYSSVIVAGLFTTSFFVVGHLTSDLAFFGGKSESEFVQQLTYWVSYILPNLEVFNVKEAAAHPYSLSTSWGEIGLKLVYGIVYSTALFLGAIVIFRRRDFK